MLSRFATAGRLAVFASPNRCHLSRTAFAFTSEARPCPGPTLHPLFTAATLFLPAAACFLRFRPLPPLFFHALGNVLQALTYGVSIALLDGDIAERDHADELTLFHHGQATDLPVRHEARGFVHIGVRLDRVEFLGENVFYGGFRRIFS